MKEQNLVIGGTVYHTLLYNRGKGKVLSYRTKNNLGDPTAYRVLVEWENCIANHPGAGHQTWCRLSELRKTPKYLIPF